jgi:hypothetical protein
MVKLGLEEVALEGCRGKLKLKPSKNPAIYNPPEQFIVTANQDLNQYGGGECKQPFHGPLPRHCRWRAWLSWPLWQLGPASFTGEGVNL